ncbi:MAG: hypothetical protein H0X66_12685 [Verrucomicrobia bacterium]|nr:hypothetical protein [Verrucomicrobiota bacterium]
MKVIARYLLLVLFVGATVATIGCKTTEEPENISSRPWGYRPGYDPGFPGMMNEGR